MNRIYILLIIIVSLIVWKPILNQVPMGEGYYYFDRCQNKFIAPNDCPTTIWQYDNLARISFQIMIPLFGDNIDLYMVAQLAMMIFLYITIYVVLSKTTNNKFFAFAVALLFLSNHTGSFSMMTIGNYQRFVQRVPNLIPVFISFYFMDRYLDKNKIKNLVISLLLLILSIYLSHHTIFILPLFIMYILFKKNKDQAGLKLSFKKILIIVAIGIATILLTKTDHFVPKEGILSYLLNTPQIIEKTLLQIPNIFIPTEIVRYLAKNWPIIPIPYPFTFILSILFLPTLFFLVAPLIFNKKGDNCISLYKAAIISLPIISFLNLYAYGEGAPHPLRDFGQDRMYFISSIPSSIIIGYYLNWLWCSKKNIFKTLSTTILITTIMYNSYLITRDAKGLESNSQKMRAFINYVKNESSDKNVRLEIIGPSHLLWPMNFVSLFYGTNNNLSFSLDSSDWKETVYKSSSDKVILIDYIDKRIKTKQIR